MSRDRNTVRASAAAHRRVAVGCVLWLAAAAAGMIVLADYEVAPGAAATAPAAWPARSRIERVPGLPTLVVLAHPGCPCTAATLAELARLMAKAQGRLSANVVFVDVPEAEATRTAHGLRARAAEIPGVRVLDDAAAGTESRLFGSVTSGQTLLYDRAGALVFSGGITAGRGHEGDNAGSAAILAHVVSGTEGAATAPVFGCVLEAPRAAAAEGDA